MAAIFSQPFLQTDDRLAKWSSFCIRRFELYFLKWKLLYFDSNLTNVYFQGFNWHQASVGLHIGLAPNRRRAFNCSTGGLVDKCICMRQPVSLSRWSPRRNGNRRYNWHAILLLCIEMHIMNTDKEVPKIYSTGTALPPDNMFTNKSK